MALADALHALLRLPGATYSCVVERDSGRVLAEVGPRGGRRRRLRRSGAVLGPRWGTAVAAMFDSTSGDELDDVMITGRRSYHLVRPARAGRVRAGLPAARPEPVEPRRGPPRAGRRPARRAVLPRHPRAAPAAVRPRRGPGGSTRCRGDAPGRPAPPPRPRPATRRPRRRSRRTAGSRARGCGRRCPDAAGRRPGASAARPPGCPRPRRGRQRRARACASSTARGRPVATPPPGERGRGRRSASRRSRCRGGRPAHRRRSRTGRGGGPAARSGGGRRRRGRAGGAGGVRDARRPRPVVGPGSGHAPSPDRRSAQDGLTQIDHAA